MKIKKDNGFTVADVIIAVIAIMIFSTIIYSLMYTYVLENVKLKKETLAMIYMTEIFENIGRTSYADITEEYIKSNFITEDMKNIMYSIDVDMTNLNKENAGSYPEDIIKKIVITVTYKAGNKYYTCSMERMKIKE